MASASARPSAVSSVDVSATAPDGHGTSTSPVESVLLISAAAAAPGDSAARLSDATVEPTGPYLNGTSHSLLLSEARIRPKDSFTSYHKPLRADASSCESTPSLLLSEPPTSASRPLTGDADAAETGIIAIGMALGSPSHPPDLKLAAWPSPFMATVTATVDAHSPGKEDASRAKSRKWGFFGRSRSKRGKGLDVGQPDQQPTCALPQSPLARTKSTSERFHKGRENGYQESKGAMASPIQRSIARSQTEPMTREQTKAPSPIPPRGYQLSGGPEQRLGQTGATAPNLDQPPSKPHSVKPLLNIEIPDVTMERYSVMFSHLLENRNTTSLLARRHAARDRLKSIKEADAPVPHPIPTRSLPKPPPPMQLAAPRQRAQRKRSNTSPPTLSSPLRPGFDGREWPGADARGAGPARQNSTTSRKPTDRRPLLISKFHRRTSSNQENIPDGDVAEKPAPMVDGNFQVGDTEPNHSHNISLSTWNTAHPPRPPLAEVTPRPAVASGAADSSLLGSPARSGSAAGSLSDGTGGGGADKAATDPVELSIARQISVSRQQRALLGTLQKQMLQNRRVNETKSSTPKLVDPRKNPDSPSAMHRKSERVVLERA